MDIQDIAKKLSILEKKTSDLLSDASKSSKMTSYVNDVKKLISQAQTTISELTVGDDGYSDKFPSIAYSILSASPFTTKTHLCIAFRCSLSTIDKWVSDYPKLEKAVEQGLLEGEVLARDLLVEAAFEPSAKINTNLIKILSTNVYDISETHDVNLKTPEPLRYQIEVVSADKTENTE